MPNGLLACMSPVDREISFKFIILHNPQNFICFLRTKQPEILKRIFLGVIFQLKCNTVLHLS